MIIKKKKKKPSHDFHHLPSNDPYLLIFIFFPEMIPIYNKETVGSLVLSSQESSVVVIDFGGKG